MSLLDRLSRRSDAVPASVPRVAVDGPVYPTKALAKFLATLTSRELPVLLDLGPVVGSNVSFFGERLGCKILVHDLFADLDRHVRESATAAFPEFLAQRFREASGSVDGVLCWDILDYLDRPAGDVVAAELTRVLRTGGALMALFGVAQPPSDARVYTKYIITDETNMRYRTYTAARGRQRTLPNRDIVRLFSGLRVTESFLLKNNLREILFRKPA
jgi:hypothetical protein